MQTLTRNRTRSRANRMMGPVWDHCSQANCQLKPRQAGSGELGMRAAVKQKVSEEDTAGCGAAWHSP